MRVNLLKRLESSINSFTITLHNYIIKLENSRYLEKNTNLYYDDISIDDLNNDEQLERFISWK